MNDEPGLQLFSPQYNAVVRFEGEGWFVSELVDGNALMLRIDECGQRHRLWITEDGGVREHKVAPVKKS